MNESYPRTMYRWGYKIEPEPVTVLKETDKTYTIQTFWMGQLGSARRQNKDGYFSDRLFPTIQAAIDAKRENLKADVDALAEQMKDRQKRLDAFNAKYPPAEKAQVTP